MSFAQPAPADRQLPRGHLLVLDRSFRRTLEAENKRPRTIEAYTDAVRKPATAHNRYRGLHAFFKWAVAEGDLEASPMGGMRPPQLSEQPVDVVGPEHLARLLKACEGRDFTSRRDTAVILLLVDTGMRRAECAGMTLDDVDLDQRIVWVLGKGRRPRALPIGRKTAQALDRYLRVRDQHRLGHPPHLWVGRNGPMTPSGVSQVVHDRARAAGLPAIHPHQLRHAFATSWLAEGGNENELMLVAGWKSRTMIDAIPKPPPSSALGPAMPAYPRPTGYRPTAATDPAVYLHAPRSARRPGRCPTAGVQVRSRRERILISKMQGPAVLRPFLQVAPTLEAEVMCSHRVQLCV
jgi:site-specific recombinase XerD